MSQTSVTPTIFTPRKRVVLGARKNDLPKDRFHLSPEQVLRFASRFFKAKPDLINEIKSRVDFGDGRPRRLSVETLLGAMLATGITGELHVPDIAATLRSLGDGRQRALGIRWKNKSGRERTVTHRQVDYLITQIVNAYSTESVEHNHPVYFEDTGLLVDTATGEILGDYEHLDEATQKSSECGSRCPWSITAETLGNKLLGDLWDYFGIPETTVFALDSYPVQSHYATKSYGSTSDIDPDNLPEEAKHLAISVPNNPVATSTAKSGNGKKWEAKKNTTLVQRRILATTYEKWEKTKRPKPGRLSRVIQPTGPRAEGSFTRIDSRFPLIGSDLRLQHSFDEGAGNTFHGAGSSRRSGIVNGRDKHTLVTTGKLPDGTPYPPLIRSYHASKGGSDKISGGIATWNYAIDTGGVITKCYLDRGYTNLAADRLLTPALRRGIDLIRDLNAFHLGVQQWKKGIILLDGFWFTDGTPDALLKLPSHNFQATRVEKKKSQASHDKRAKFAYRPMGQMIGEKRRYRGPSTGTVTRNKRGVAIGFTGATARCVNNAHYGLMSLALPKTKCKKSQDCGCSKTVLINMKDLPSSYEPLHYGTSKWAKAKGNRNVVESYNSVEQFHRRVHKHSIRVRAHKWDFMHALLNAAIFIKTFYNWLIRLGAWAIEDYHPLDMPVVRKCMQLVSTPATSPPPSP